MNEKLKRGKNKNWKEYKLIPFFILNSNIPPFSCKGRIREKERQYGGEMFLPEGNKPVLPATTKKGKRWYILRKFGYNLHHNLR